MRRASFSQAPRRKIRPSSRNYEMMQDLRRSSRLSAPAAPLQEIGDLVALTARGDLNALATIFARYASVVHRTALRLTASADDADDVVQDVFIGLPNALSRYDNRGSFDAWLRGVMTAVTVRSGSRAPLLVALLVSRKGSRWIRRP